MTTFFVTYQGNSSSRFDRQYYVGKHLPLAREIGGPLGLQSIEAFFPAGKETDILAACRIVFRDDQAVQDVFSGPRGEELLNDRTNFTDLMPIRSLITMPEA